MMLTTAAIEGMGFRPFDASERLRARFRFIQVIAIEGVTMASTEVASATINGHVCQFALSPSVNSACNALLSDDFVPDESVWEREKSCSGPYAMVVLGPTEEYVAESGYRQPNPDGGILTYNTFAQAKASLRRIADSVLPQLLTALACQLKHGKGHLRLLPIDLAMPGVTSDGDCIHDVVVTGQISAYQSRPAPENIRTQLENAAQLSQRLVEKSARLLRAGLFEQDALKRFRYFFIALEVDVHAKFRTIDHDTSLASLVPEETVAPNAARDLKSRNPNNRRDLRDRFVWCALFRWTSIDDHDVSEFKRLKNIRDELMHGSKADVVSQDLIDLEGLTLKALGQ